MNYTILGSTGKKSIQQLAYHTKLVATQAAKDGTEFQIELVTQALTYREQPIRVVAVRDITERKEAAETLRQQNRILWIGCKSL